MAGYIFHINLKSIQQELARSWPPDGRALCPLEDDALDEVGHELIARIRDAWPNNDTWWVEGMETMGSPDDVGLRVVFQGEEPSDGWEVIVADAWALTKEGAFAKMATVRDEVEAAIEWRIKLGEPRKEAVFYPYRNPDLAQFRAFRKFKGV